MNARMIFDEVQANMQDRERLAQKLQLEAKALRAQAEYAAETKQAQRAARPRFGRLAPRFRASPRVRMN